jgi:hypothetical protein
MKVLAVGGLIAHLVSLPAFANCVEPPAPPHLPDGATASRDDMLSAMKAVKAYDSAVKEFSECASQNGGILAAQVDRAMDKLTAIADKFNVELRVFKTKSGT